MSDIEAGVESLNNVTDSEGYTDEEVYAAAANYFDGIGRHFNTLLEADYDQVFRNMKAVADSLGWEMSDHAIHQVISHWRGDWLATLHKEDD